ncbi:hypothetical protein HUT19_41155 [Streptomyces sp. NA02950]|uniref:hypothetical protein n=1 Tax=Streptomyces sp. NA02950 TaxID=2742137 RepID=UPI00158FB107|nr:hypothetical protein [Streptomyces sp. NA02950]QKV90376.1 hypothetical protein HUT19_00065 [Streptomyces sp. NA02950]QKV97291.1 hypothetical protein HUT19_41155 [Streptomyces sp. NA02950]
MTFEPDDIAEQQADITRLLLHHFHMPLPGGQFIRGILPAPLRSEAIQVVTGPLPRDAADELTAWQIPLASVQDPESLLSGEDVLAIVRALLSGTHIYSSNRVDTVMGMPLVRVDVASLKPAPASSHDGAFTILRSLTCPWTEDQPEPRLRGFLLHAPDRLRLYLDREDDTTVTAADVRPSGAVTALVSALGSLITEEPHATDHGDPYCATLMDLTHW